MLAYGAFITVVINFLLVAFVLFQLVKVSNRMKKAESAAARRPDQVGRAARRNPRRAEGQDPRLKRGRNAMKRQRAGVDTPARLLKVRA